MNEGEFRQTLAPPQKALLVYMEYLSEDRWAAGWQRDLHVILLGDDTYEWLVSTAGGWFTGHWPTEFVPGTLDELKGSTTEGISHGD